MAREFLLIVLLIGTAGTLLPFIPGIPLMFIAILTYGIFDNWMHFSPSFVIVVGIITFFTFFLDYFAASWGVKKLGAGKKGIWGGILGSIGGILFFGPIGLFLGSFLGVVVGELLAGKIFSQALKISFGNFLGLLGSTLLQLTFALIILFWVILKLY